MQSISTLCSELPIITIYSKQRQRKVRKGNDLRFKQWLEVKSVLFFNSQGFKVMDRLD
jgi:hypothetical protein